MTTMGPMCGHALGFVGRAWHTMNITTNAVPYAKQAEPRTCRSTSNKQPRVRRIVMALVRLLLPTWLRRFGGKYCHHWHTTDGQRWDTHKGCRILITTVVVLSGVLLSLSFPSTLAAVWLRKINRAVLLSCLFQQSDRRRGVVYWWLRVTSVVCVCVCVCATSSESIFSTSALLLYVCPVRKWQNLCCWNIIDLKIFKYISISRIPQRKYVFLSDAQLWFNFFWSPKLKCVVIGQNIGQL